MLVFLFSYFVMKMYEMRIRYIRLIGAILTSTFNLALFYRI